MIKIIDYLKRNHKGQGLTEYVLILAFIAGVAFMMFGGEGGLKGTVVSTFDKTVELLANLDDSRSPEEKDLANLKKVTNAVADNLKLSSSPTDTSTWNKVEDGQLVIQKNYAVLYVFPDGSTDLFVDGLSGQALNSDWGPFWLSDIKDKYPERYDAYVTALSNSGVDLNDSGAMKINSSDSSNTWTNGYAVVLDGAGNVSTWGINDSTNINKSNYRESANPGRLTYNAQFNKWEGNYSKVTGLE